MNDFAGSLAAAPTPWRTWYMADRRCNDDKRDLLAGPPRVTACARRSERRVALAKLATATQWDTDPQETGAVVRRSKCNHAFARTRSRSIAWQMRRSSAR